MSNKSKQLKEREMKIVIEFYKSNPALFFERELGVKLSGWQRALLKLVKGGGYKDV